MRQAYSAITPAVVRSTAHTALQQTLPWKRYGRRVSVARLLDVLLLVAAGPARLSASFWHRDELSSDECGQGSDDGEGRGVSVPVNRFGVVVASGVGVVNVTFGAGVALSFDAVAWGVAVVSCAGLVTAGGAEAL